jgi:hypothetical protein
MTETAGHAACGRSTCVHRQTPWGTATWGRHSGMDHSAEEVARRVLDRYGRTYAEEADIRLTDDPAPLFQLLVLAQLLAARIGAGVAVAAAVELRTVGCTTPKAVRDAKRPAVIAALGRAGYRRYDERTATQLHDMAELVLARYGGDLRRLAGEADGDVVRAGPGGQGHRPDRCRRLPARGSVRLALGAALPGRPGACGRPADRPARRRRTTRGAGRTRRPGAVHRESRTCLPAREERRPLGS